MRSYSATQQDSVGAKRGAEQDGDLRRETMAKHARGLIVSSGDLSDVDGFLALAEYARTGFDVLYILNFPGYLGVAEPLEEPEGGLLAPDPGFPDKTPNMGFRYPASAVLERDRACTKYRGEEEAASAQLAAYKALLAPYYDFADAAAYQADGSEGRLSIRSLVRRAITRLAFGLVAAAWDEGQRLSKGRTEGTFFFQIGGVNAVNPFSDAAVKNELLCYAGLLADLPPACPAERFDEQGATFDCRGSYLPDGVPWAHYGRVVMDFNGSAAFFTPAWTAQMGPGRLAALFVMGGVRTDAVPATMPASRFLSRLSCATMNQLYDPARSAALLRWAQGEGAACFVVSNNVVDDLKTADAVYAFMRARGLAGPQLQAMAKAYYENPFLQAEAPRKVFDVYTAAALVSHLAAPGAPAVGSRQHRLYFSGVNGVTLLAPLEHDTFPLAVLHYIRQGARHPSRAADLAQEGARFLAPMATEDEACDEMRVSAVAFRYSPDTHQLTVLE